MYIVMYNLFVKPSIIGDTRMDYTTCTFFNRGGDDEVRSLQEKDHYYVEM